MIEVRALTKVYPGDIHAVEEIDLDVEDGQIFGFIGPNGAGKSTLIHILTTLVKPTSGEVRVAGFDVAAQPDEVRRFIGVALQEVGLDQHATGREFMELHARLHGFDRRAARRRASELLQAVSLEDAADRRVKTYSGGMKRRLDLASALVHHPRVLFLDEPTTGLDTASRQQVWDEVRLLNQEEGCTVFLTTHYLEEVDRVADDVAIIDKGRIVARGSPEDLKETLGHEAVLLAIPLVERGAAVALIAQASGVSGLTETADGVSFVAEDDVHTLVRVLNRLEEANISVESVAMQRPSLDDVFLQATDQRSARTPGG